jgi:small subunit ribosomal protein S16
MATVIRLKRVGAKKEASYRIVVTDSRKGSSGAEIERLGTYNPRTKPAMIRVDPTRALHWLKEGAKPSFTVRSLLKKTGVWRQFKEKVDLDTLESGMVEVGPPEGERGTSQRPPPTDRAPKQYDQPAPEVAESKSAEVAAEEVAEVASEEVAEDKL